MIAGCKHCCGFDCAPDLNKFYRSVYLGIAGAFILFVTALLMISGTFLGSIGLGMFAGFGCYGLIAGSINRVASGSLAGWNFAGNYTTTVLIVAATLLPGILLGTALPDTLLWATAATAALLGVTEIKRRDL